MYKAQNLNSKFFYYIPKRETSRGVGQMKIFKLYSILVLISFIIVIFNLSCAQVPDAQKFIFDHQDAAGDVLKYNATINGEPVVDEPEMDSLDFKWVHSETDTLGNVVLTMDLKAKNKFLNEDETKYVFRLLTSPDNTTGYNITYQNHSAILTPFTNKGNGTTVNIFHNVTFDRDKGDEMMVITVSIERYLSNITHFNVDAYSMKIMNNATYLDYISELPGHPEYVNPEVESGEDLNGGSGDSETSDGDSSTPILVGLGIVIIVVILLVVIIILWLAKKT